MLVYMHKIIINKKRLTKINILQKVVALIICQIAL